MDLHNTVWDPPHPIITNNTHTTITRVVSSTSPRPIRVCLITPQDLTDNRGFISEDQPVNPPPTGLSTTVPTLVNYHRAMKEPPLHPFMAIITVAVWTVVSCGISNLCHSTMVNCLHQTVITNTNTTSTSIRLTSR